MELLENNKLRRELNNDLSPGLLRQRRNLMVVSLIIIFMEVSGAQLGNISLLGVSITFDKPESISLFLIAFLVYFLYRYSLYYRQEGHSFRGVFCNELYQKSWRKIQAIRNEKFPSEIDRGGNFNICRLKKTGFLKGLASTDISDGMGGLLKQDFEVEIIKLWKEILASIFVVLFKERFVTDYCMPFIISVFALVAVYLKFV